MSELELSDSPGGLTHTKASMPETRFAVGRAPIPAHKRMHRFMLRTKLKVDVQWTRTRFALVHNIGKIHTFGAIH